MEAIKPKPSAALTAGKGRYSAEKGATFWFTGLSGSGKTTLSSILKEKIDEMIDDKKKVFILDGDLLRSGLNKNLGYSKEDRAESDRRIAEVTKLLTMSG